jgi:hypothetical protein
MATDLVKGALSAEEHKTILQDLADIRAKLPFLIDLTPEERRALPEMGDKSRAFIEQGLAAAQQNPGILPRQFDLDEYSRDVELTRQLGPLVMAPRQLQELL